MKWAFDLVFFMYASTSCSTFKVTAKATRLQASLSLAPLYAANSPHESENNKISSECAAVSPFFKMKLDIFKSDGGKLCIMYNYKNKHSFFFY